MSGEQNNSLATFFSASANLPWTDTFRGPALALPDEYKLFALNGHLIIEYLRVEGDDADQGEVQIPNKNHVVIQVPFMREYDLVDSSDNNIVAVYGARISMDLTGADECLKNIDKARLEDEYREKDLLGDYYPGTMHVKLLKYEGISTRAYKFTTFSNLDFCTLGELVDFLKGKKLHEMSFIGYGQAWKGCHAFLQLRLEGKVAEVDHEGHSLKHNITRVHHNDGDSHEKLIDRGAFLTYVPFYPIDIVDAYEVEDEAI